MLPLRDNLPRGRWPLVTAGLAAANVLALAAPGDPRRWGLVPSALVLRPETEWPALFTSLFAHAGWLHLGVNLLYLGVFGPAPEGRLGPLRFALLYCTGGVFAGLVQTATDPWSNVPVVGASGAVAAVLGAYLMIFPSAQVYTVLPLPLPRRVGVPAWVYLGLWFALQLVAPVGLARGAHIGGFLVGFVLGRLHLAARGRKPPRRRAPPKAAPPPARPRPAHGPHADRAR